MHFIENNFNHNINTLKTIFIVKNVFLNYFTQ